MDREPEGLECDVIKNTTEEQEAHSREYVFLEWRDLNENYVTKDLIGQ